MYLTDQIETLAGLDFVEINDPTSVAKNTETIAKQIDSAFWLSFWTLKSLDTSGGREVILDDIKHIRQNQKDKIAWNNGLTLIGSEHA